MAKLDIDFQVGFSCNPHSMPGTLSGISSSGAFGTIVGNSKVFAIDVAAVVVVYDQDGYVVCHWPLSYVVVGVKGEAVELTIVDDKNWKFEVYEGKEVVEVLLVGMESEYGVLPEEVPAVAFQNDMEEVEDIGTGTTVVASAKLAENGLGLERFKDVAKDA